MKAKVFIGSAVAMTLMGVGVLAGSVIGSTGAAAQTPAATATAQTTPATSSTSVKPGITDRSLAFPGGRGHSHKGGPGHGSGPGHDGGLNGRFLNGATADNATRQITHTTELITLVKNDLVFATGKMDTADVQRWLNGADSLRQSAQSANSNSQFGQAVAYAAAARELAMTAGTQMAQELGADTLPSYDQMPRKRDKAMADSTTVTQVQASWILSETYNRLVTQAAQVRSASNASQATPYLTEAQGAYQAAYDAYQAGNYSDALVSAKLAARLAGVATTVAYAATAPANTDTPVTVPAPNF